MRYGAGRPGHKAKAEHLQRVDVREWARRGYLRGACAFSWSWQRGGEPAGTIGVRVHGPDALTLNYTVTVSDRAHDVAERLTILNTPCAFGGARPWFRCPCCARRVAVLYLRGGRFACRLCKRVAYSSQSEDELGRMWRQQARIEAKLGERYCRPKGMRLHTYTRLMNRYWELESRRAEAVAVVVARWGF